MQKRGIVEVKDIVLQVKGPNCDLDDTGFGLDDFTMFCRLINHPADRQNTLQPILDTFEKDMFG